MTVFLHAKKLGKVLTGDADLFIRIVSDHNLHGGFAADGGQLALEIAHAGLAGVGADGFKQGIVGQAQILGSQPVGLYLLGQEKVLADVGFFRLQIAGQPDDLHAVLQGQGNGMQGVGRGDEEYLGQVIVHIQIVIVEGVVLLRIKHFQQGRRGIAPEVRAHFVYFVKAEQRVVGADPFEGLDDFAGQRPHIGTPVAAHFGLVAHAAEGETDEFPPRGSGH